LNRIDIADARWSPGDRTQEIHVMTIRALLTNARVRLAHVFAAIAMLAACTAFVACETTEGFGQDVEKLGDNIEDAADDAGD
jgi:predicted small secreted protein